MRRLAVSVAEIAELRRQLSYDPKTGIFRWAVNKRGPRKSGDIAGCRWQPKRGGPRWKVKANGRVFDGGRLAWILYYGKDAYPELDHRDGDALNNRINNLREATHFQNAQNVPSRGIRYEADRKKWLARICIAGKQINLGRYETEEGAIQAYITASIKYRGQFSRKQTS